MIDLINHLVVMNLYKVPPERILLLTPHCLQENTCIHKVTHDVYNCKQCGRCQVGGLLKIAKEYGCQFIVVTGGTLARMKVKEAKPKAIIAKTLKGQNVDFMQGPDWHYGSLDDKLLNDALKSIDRHRSNRREQ